MRLCVDNLAREVLYPIMGILFATKDIPAPATHEAKSLFNFTAESVEKHHKRLLSFDEWGIVPAGHRGPRTNPWAAEPEYVDESPEADEGEDSGEYAAPRDADPSGEDGASGNVNPSGEEAASRGADPSGGDAGSSRSAPAGEDVEVISSGSDEDAFRMVRRTAEERRGGMGGRCEPRSKLLHDRDAGAAKRGAPQEGAAAPPEEAGASTLQPPKGKKRVWRAADE